MTLLFIDGFDAQDYNLKWISTLALTPSFAETTAYGMGSAIKPSSSSGRLARTIPASAQIIVGFRFKLDNLSSTHVLWSSYADSGVQQHAVLQTSSTGQLQALRASITLASSAAGLIVAGSWNYVEIRATIANAGGIFEVLLNGVQVINFVGDTQNAGTSTNFDMIVLGGTTNADAAVAYDDLYALNTAGAAPQNTFLGEVVVQTLLPNGPGAHTEFDPIGSAANWENVDDVPPSASDYNASNIVGEKDSYGLSNLVGAVGTIFGVQENLIASKTGVGAASLKSLVRSGGTDYTQPAVALNASPQWYGALRETDPATAAAWTSSAVNALEVGAEVA